jgi:hypothetical protein
VYFSVGFANLYEKEQQLYINQIEAVYRWTVLLDQQCENIVQDST